jgi:Lrp/AsnC family leucine-responsive transcriptional regulator
MLSELDPTDIGILKLLQDNARLTNLEIGKVISKSPSSVYQRIKKMQDQGYILKYGAVLDNNKIDRGLVAFTHVQLKDHSQESLRTFESQIILSPEVLECYHMSGMYDFILRVAVKDLNTYHDFLMNKLFGFMAVGNVQSTFVMKESKSETAFPISPGKAGK